MNSNSERGLLIRPLLATLLIRLDYLAIEMFIII